MTKSKTLTRSGIEIPFDCFLTARATKIEACVLISQYSKTGAYHLSSRSTIKKENSADMKEKKNSHLPSILWRWIVDFGMKFLRFAGIFGHKCSSLKSVRVAIKLVSSIRQPLHSKTIVNGYNASRYLEFFFSKLSRMLVLVSFSLVTRTLGAIYWILDVTTKTVFDYSPAWFQNTWPNCSQCTFSLTDSLKLKHTRMLLSNWTSNPWKFLKLETTVFLVNNQAVQTSRRWTFIQVRSTRWNSDVHVMWFKLWRFVRRKYHWLPVVLIQEEFESENSFII